MFQSFTPDTPLRVQIVLFNGFDLLDAIAPYEVFLAAADASNGAVQVTLVSAEGPRKVPCGLSSLLIPAEGWLAPEIADIVLLPGAAGKTDSSGADSIPVLLNQAAQTGIAPQMRQALERPETLVATVCGGSLILAMAGLIEQRHAVTHHLGMPVLTSLGVSAVNARVVDDGDLVSGGGVTSGLDLALYLIGRTLGPQIALSIEALFDYERRGTVWRAHGMASQPTFVEPQVQIEPSLAPESPSPASRFVGQWDAQISTPVGVLKIRFDIELKDGVIRGLATQGEETVAFNAPQIDGDQLRWTQRVSKPMKLNLLFVVRVDANVMTGSAKAGVLPASRLVGRRRESID
ncbi:DJ-1/PfpI family protein [Pseudomonas sp. TH34]|uniref:DJ-1/PfpI family protein n=1 Tax=Pseudomonas sp. TH34 TaxID=2796399 RepID=UPI001912B9C5|nr:DJ-1/PfpI family protein [Pseudomonas sp. TH34]